MSAIDASAGRRPACRPCWGCIGLALALIAAVAASFAYLAVDYRQLFSDESMRLMAKFVGEFFPPDRRAGVPRQGGLGRAARPSPWRRSARLLAVGLGAADRLPAGRPLRPRAAPGGTPAAQLPAQRPELVWAALMVIAAGLGPFAGTLALACTRPACSAGSTPKASRTFRPRPSARCAKAAAAGSPRSPTRRCRSSPRKASPTRSIASR
jgi:phosphonate transport system permease protein